MSQSQEEQLYRGFSCPHEKLSGEFAEMLVVGRSKYVTRAFIDCYQSKVEQFSRGLIALFTEWLDEPNDFEVAWDVAFGQLWNAVLRTVDTRARRVEARIDLCAGLAALHLTFCGMKGTWSIKLQDPARLRIGSWLLPVAEHITVESAGRTTLLTVALDDDRATYLMDRQTGELRGKGGEALPCAEYASNRYVILPSYALGGIELSTDEVDVETGHEKEASDCLKAGLQVLSAGAPIYLPWIGTVTRYIVSLQSGPEELRSASDINRPGLLCLSNHRTPLETAEMLVHEAAHQYMYILRSLGKLDDGTDSAFHFSPIKNTKRPISGIVVAYHAMANVSLLYNSCITAGFDDGYCGANRDDLVPKLGVLEQTWLSSHALTPLGRALCEPLYERLRM